MKDNKYDYLRELYEKDPSKAILELLDLVSKEESPAVKRYLLIYEKLLNLDREEIKYHFMKDLDSILKYNKEDIKNATELYFNERVKEIIKNYYSNSNAPVDYKRFESEFGIFIMSDDEIKQYEDNQFDFYGIRKIVNREERIYYSLTTLERIYVDNMSNEAMYSVEEINLIEESIELIKTDLYQKDLDSAQIRLVSLQLLMGIKVDFISTLKMIYKGMIKVSNYLSIENLKGKQDDGRDLSR